jgi:transposase-like protein
MKLTGNVEEAILETCLSGICTRKAACITDAPSKVKVDKDAVSRISARLEEEQKEWRERPLKEKAHPYLYLGAAYLKGTGAKSPLESPCRYSSGRTSEISGEWRT